MFSTISYFHPVFLHFKCNTFPLFLVLPLLKVYLKGQSHFDQSILPAGGKNSEEKKHFLIADHFEQNVILIIFSNISF